MHLIKAIMEIYMKALSMQNISQAYFVLCVSRSKSVLSIIPNAVYDC